MTVPRLEDVLRETGVPDLIEILAERLTATELEAVLCEAYQKRAGRVVPAALLAEYERDPRFQPASARGAALPAIDRLALEVAGSFEPLDLSPICPVGTVAGLSPAHEGVGVGVAGVGELVSDSTTVLALESARRRRSAGDSGPTVRLSASHREMYIHFWAPPRGDPHARVFALCTAGRDVGAWQFEAGSVREHLGIHLRLLENLRQAGSGIGNVSVAFAHAPYRGLATAIGEGVIEPLAREFPAVGLIMDGAPARTFTPIGFTLLAEDPAEVEHPIALGGTTDWSRQMLGRDDERVVVSRVATERLVEVCGPHATTLK
jgi:hypothetical protein